MDAQHFLVEFGHIANAPGGVDRIKELVLQFAISGRLTEREPGDASAEELIEANRRRQLVLVSERKLKKQPSTTRVSSASVPWLLPEGWAWTRLGAVTNYGESQKVQPEDAGEDTWVLELEDIEKGTSRLLNRVFAKERKFKSTKNGFPAGAVLYGKLRPYLDKVIVADTEGVCTTEINPISFFDNIDSGYLRWFLKSPYFIAYADGSTYGMNLPRLGTESAREALFPFPPKKEQSQIVAKVDELMALCDKLELQQQTRRTLQNNLRQSTLQAVASATRPHELQTTWTRLAENFGQLFHAPEDIKELRDLASYLALRGVFLPESQLGAGAARSDANDTLPTGWVWKTLADLSEYVTSGSRGWKAYIASSGDPFIRSQDIKHDALIFENPAFVNLPVKVEGKRTLVRRFDLLLTITGGNVGRCAVVPALANKAYVSQHVALIRLHEPRLAEFIHYWMICAFGGQAFLAQYIYGDKPGLNLTQVGNIRIPVPPMTNLPKILDSLRSIERLCAKWSAHLRSKRDVAETLAAATVVAFTGVAMEEEEEPVKVPQTELIAPLRLGAAPDVKAQAPLATILARHNSEMAAKDLWQRFGGEIDAFYAQLKAEVAHGWILEPAVAEMREKIVDTASA